LEQDRRLDDGRTEGIGDQSVQAKDDESDPHKNKTQRNHLPSRVQAARRYELGQEGEEEQRQLRVEQIEQNGLSDHGKRFFLVLDRNVDFILRPQQSHAQIQKVQDPDDPNDAVNLGAGIEDCRNAQDCRQDMGHDPQCAPQGRQDRLAPAARQACGNGVDDPRARHQGQDQRCDDKACAHGLTPLLHLQTCVNICCDGIILSRIKRRSGKCLIFK